MLDDIVFRGTIVTSKDEKLRFSVSVVCCQRNCHRVRSFVAAGWITAHMDRYKTFTSIIEDSQPLRKNDKKYMVET